jgi:hypothetical protein
MKKKIANGIQRIVKNARLPMSTVSNRDMRTEHTKPIVIKKLLTTQALFIAEYGLKSLLLFFTLIFKSISFKSLFVSIHKEVKNISSFQASPIF